MLWARVVRGISSTANDVTPVVGDLLDYFQRSQRPQEADQHLVPTQQRKVGRAGGIVRAVAKHLDNNIGRAKHGRPVRKNLCALFEHSARLGNPLQPRRQSR